MTSFRDDPRAVADEHFDTIAIVVCFVLGVGYAAYSEGAWTATIYAVGLACIIADWWLFATLLDPEPRNKRARVVVVAIAMAIANGVAVFVLPQPWIVLALAIPALIRLLAAYVFWPR